MIILNSLRNAIETISITAIIDTALSVGAGGSAGSLADKPIVRNAEKNLIIPASQVKGRLRHECEKIARALKWDICESPKPVTMCPQRLGLSGNFGRDEYLVRGRQHCLICQIFGNPALPSRLLFDDLVCLENPDDLPEVIRPGVTINRRRQTAEESKLYFLETSPANANLQFKGQIHLLPNWSSDRPDFAKALVYAGLRHINALGGSKSAGLGWLHWQIDASNLAIEDEIWSFLAKGDES
jgi:CRISPR/Cas system CSM-associated protein Csm3 (group 7 of RAMP superfamily)